MLSPTFLLALIGACALLVLASAAFCAATPRAAGRLRGGKGVALGTALSLAAVLLLARAGLGAGVALAVALAVLILGIPSAGTLAALRKRRQVARG